MNSLIRFLGGITFAIILISTTALFVIAGTIIESATDSHRYASLFTYDSGLFSLLLWGFFINILVSALRRWPFQRKHLPFLVTHLGLLMILAGLLIKSSYGVQGSISLIEGSASNEIFLGDSYALYLEKSLDEGEPKSVSFSTFKEGFPSHSEIIAQNLPEDVHITLLQHHSHSREKLATWIKGDQSFLLGNLPLPVHSISSKDVQLPESTEIHLAGCSYPWKARAIKTPKIAEIAEKAYLEGLKTTIGDRINNRMFYEGPLSGALNKEIVTPYGALSCRLDFNWTPISGFLNPALIVQLQRDLGEETITIPLNGEDALLAESSRKIAGKAPLFIDLAAVPTLVFLEDPNEDLYFFKFSNDGQMAVESFRQDSLKRLIVYNEGFDGYAVQAEIPFLNACQGRQDREMAYQHLFAVELRQAVSLIPQISNSSFDSSDISPLSLFYDSCRRCHIDVAKVAVEFLEAWENSEGWLFNHPRTPLSTDLNNVLNQIEWQKLPSNIYRGCLWNVFLFEKIDHLLKLGMDPAKAIEKLEWPAQFIQEGGHSSSLFRTITLQIFAASNQLPEPTTAVTPTSAQLLSAYFAAYEIRPDLLHSSKTTMPMAQAIKFWRASHQLHSDLQEAKIHVSQIATLPNEHPILSKINDSYRKFLQSLNQETTGENLSSEALSKAVKSFIPLDNGLNNNQAIKLQPLMVECPLTAVQIPMPPSKKMENNNPALLLRIESQGKEELVSLGFDRFANRIKWPILNGRFVARFQPLCQSIPYRLRLRQARQINYPGTQQPYSYECDLVINDKTNNVEIEKTISMNEVHETWDGYRFYLANVFPPSPGEIKRVQIVVNYDPAKYLLTYPGASILSLGIFLLFWKRKKKPQL